MPIDGAMRLQLDCKDFAVVREVRDDVARETRSKVGSEVGYRAKR